MSTSKPIQTDPAFMKNAIEASIRIGILVLLVGWCFKIVEPFITPIVWGIIIAVAIFPLFEKLQSAMGGRSKLAATVITLLGLAVIIVPTVLLAGSLAETTEALAEGYMGGTLKIPPPAESVANWPVVGKKLYQLWSLASTNLEAALQQIGPQLKIFGNWLLATGAGAGAGILQFVVSIILAGVLVASASGGKQMTVSISSRLMGDRGPEFADIAGATVRSVAQGVLGVALIQSIAAGLGLLILGVPGAGLWALLVLLLAVVQLPPLLVLGPIIIWVFSAYDTVPAVLFMIWGLLVSGSDTFLKPLLLGRGVDIPMLVILLGAIGGMLMSGILGLFIGAVILALGYKLFMAWLTEDGRRVVTEDSSG